MAESIQSLTLLENELLQKVNYLKSFLYEPLYFPKRVEPGLKVPPKTEKDWSKFSGETLFINLNLLKDDELREGIFWRESFLLFTPRQSRDAWWVKLLADVFPLSIKMSSQATAKWIQFIRKSFIAYKELYRLLKRIIAAAGIDGLFQAFNKVQYFVYSKEQLESHKSRRKRKKREINPHEMQIILTEIYYNSVKITSNAIEIMQKALLRQTIKPKIIAQYLTKHLATVSKTIKQLVAMGILHHNYFVNLSALGLTQYITLLFPSKKAHEHLKPPSNPFLTSQKLNRLTNSIITQLYAAPKSKLFFKYLKAYCEELINQRIVYDYYLFEIKNSKRIYTFKYFNPKERRQIPDFNTFIIESGLYQNEPSNGSYDALPPDRIVIPSAVFHSKLKKVDFLDLQIINQFLQGVETYRAIRKAVNKDMNELVKRIKRLFEEKILFENVLSFLPYSSSELTVYFEKEKPLKKSDYRTFDQRLVSLFSYLPNVYLATFKGAFEGILARTFLTPSTCLEMADFLTTFYPSKLSFQLVLGKPIFQKHKLTLPINRWLNGEWLYNAEDFSS
ncbi:MAG: hypothetical protein DRO63_03265 [Candidatus Gerdarchaeota archaeon]|nr:MAG: hypothetical protein DRO63_03265 [Candidatus Gerdarchaeota archaeon]